jgi:hypothetical protein
MIKTAFPDVTKLLTQDPTITLQQCQSVLEKTQSNVVWEILRQCQPFVEWDHYPKDDVYDKQSHCQYYYHAHPATNTRAPEHGHFHLFMHPKGFQRCYTPIYQTKATQPDNASELCHLVAISMDNSGQPIRLFTTNQWVSGETWYCAQDVCEMLDHFRIDHAYPSWPTNLWLSALVQWFAPEIKSLIHMRDQTIHNWQTQYPNQNVFENRQLEITSFMDISIEQ